MTIRIAQLSCGTEYSGVQFEIESAARAVGAKIVYPDVSYSQVQDAIKRFGFKPKSQQLQLMIARAASLVDGKYDADAVFITTCFRCAEAALVRNELRRFIQENTKLPVVTYSFTERLKAAQLLTRMEALVTIVTRKDLLAREKQSGLTAGLDSGSSTTKAVIMEDNKIIGKAWTPSGAVVTQTAHQVLDEALEQSGYKYKDIECMGSTGYGRYTLGKEFKDKCKLVQEELTVNSKGAVWLADRQKGEATIIDIGGMDNKAITVRDGIPDNFTMGGICAGASGRFLQMTANRLKIPIEDLGDLAMKGDWTKAKMNSYCSVFGIQDLVTQLGEGKSFEDVAAAACHSVAEQVYEQQLQEIDVRHPIIEVGGTSLIKGLVREVGSVLGEPPIVPKDSQYIGAVGGALLSSGLM
ncbi:MAG: methanogenesis marker 15 protein [Methanomethylophilus sp.]